MGLTIVGSFGKLTMCKITLLFSWVFFLGYSSDRKPSRFYKNRGSVVQYWNTIATRGRYTHLACQANFGIESCSWTHGSIELSSETTSWDKDWVAIGRSEGSPEDDMCYLFIDSVNDSHSGRWDCTVLDECYGECRRDEPSQQLMLEVLKEGEFGVIWAQEEFFGLVGSPVLLTVRANERIDKCMISKNGVDILDIDGDAREDVCVFPDISGSGDGRICAEINKEYHSCILKIDSVTAGLGGSWTFTLENGRNLWAGIVK